MLPPPLIEEFWADVHRRLKAETDRGDAEIWAWTQAYRRRLAEREVGDLLYHQSAEAVAKAILSAIIVGGFPEVAGSLKSPASVWPRYP